MLREKLADEMKGVTSEVPEPRPSTLPPQQSGQTVPGPINMRQTVPGPVIAQPVAHSTCGNCKGYDHKTSQCWCIQLDGYIHGCVICDSPDHDTSECQEFAEWDRGARVAVLVNSRANLPPLRGKNWFHLLESYLKEELKRGKSYNETLQQLNGLPWTLEFSQACRQDPARMEQLHRIMVLDPFARQCPDPNTETWDKAKRYLARVRAEKPVRNAKRELQQIRTRARALAEENGELKTRLAQATSQNALSDQILSGMENAIQSNGGSRPLKRRRNTTPPPTDDEECCLARTLNVIAARAALFQMVEDDQFDMDVVLILTKALSDVGRGRKLLKFLEAGTTGVWFCFHEAYEKGRRTEISIDPLHQNCTNHGNVCSFLVMVEAAGSKRRLKFLHLSRGI